MRDMAAQRLAAAYRCDEIATSVATMQSASSLDDVAAHVLRRNAQDLDALYVHFFHEKDALCARSRAARRWTCWTSS